MTAAFWLRNIASFATQAAIVVSAGVVIWRLTRVRHGVVSHAYWRALLLACLLLPIAQPWHAPQPLDLAPKTAAITEPASAAAESDVKTAETTAPLRNTTPASRWLLLVLGAGIAARAFWLCIGASSLARLRRSAVLVDPPTPGIRSAHANVRVRADVCVSPHVAGPITFGFRRPLVILPPGVLAMDDRVQEAIVSHELMHVRRHDWLNVVAEEIVRTIFWFHPVLWWLINRIQLSREHVVDEAVVALTKSRERYVEAMLAVALSRSPLSFAPAPQFLRRRSLKRRVAHILQETTMTTRRLIASVAATAGVVIVAGVLVVRAFPLEARAPQQEARIDAGTPVVIARGGEHLLHASLPEYPRRALDQRVEGEVALEIAVDDQGEVSDARVVSGPDELRRAALESVLQWHYLASRVSNTTLPVALRFNAAAVAEEKRKVAEPVETVGIALRKKGEKREPYFVEYRPLEKRELTSPEEMEVEIKKVEVAVRHAPASLELPQRLAGVRTERVSNGLVKEILDRAGLSVGAMIPSKVALTQIRETIEAFDPHLRVRFEHDAKGGLIVVLIAP